MCCMPNTARIHSSQEGNHQGAPRPGGSAPEGRNPLWGFSVGNKMAHARERAFPVLSSSCFRNKQADPAQTPLSSTDGRLGNTESLPDYRLRRSPVSPATCRLYCHLPGVSWELEHQGWPATKYREKSDQCHEVRLTPGCWGQREGGTCGDEPANPTLPASPPALPSALLPHEQVISFPSENGAVSEAHLQDDTWNCEMVTMKMYLRGARHAIEKLGRQTHGPSAATPLPLPTAHTARDPGCPSTGSLSFSP